MPQSWWEEDRNDSPWEEEEGGEEEEEGEGGTQAWDSCPRCLALPLAWPAAYQEASEARSQEETMSGRPSEEEVVVVGVVVVGEGEGGTPHPHDAHY